MNKLGAAVSFLALSIILFIGRNFIHHLVAAIMGSSNGTISSGKYDMALDLTSTYSIIPEVILLILAIVFMIWWIISKEKEYCNFIDSRRNNLLLFFFAQENFPLLQNIHSYI